MSVPTPTTLTLSSGSLGSLGDGIDDAVNASSIADGVSGTSRNGSSSYNWSAPLAGMAVHHGDLRSLSLLLERPVATK
jgi:hypothetical protein